MTGGALRLAWVDALTTPYVGAVSIRDHLPRSAASGYTWCPWPRARLTCPYSRPIGGMRVACSSPRGLIDPGWAPQGTDSFDVA